MCKNSQFYFKYIASIFLGAVFFLSCTNKSIKEWNELEKTTKPDIVGYNVEIIYSDNGKVKFQLKTPQIIEQYKDNKPYIYICPKGVKLWQYDTLRQVNFTIVADSAYIIEPKEYYELWGNIILERKQDSTWMKTEKIIIDKVRNIVFADTVVVINKYGELKDATAKGFRSDLQFEKPEFIELTQGEVNYQQLKFRSSKKDSLVSFKK